MHRHLLFCCCYGGWICQGQTPREKTKKTTGQHSQGEATACALTKLHTPFPQLWHLLLTTCVTIFGSLSCSYCLLVLHGGPCPFAHLSSPLWISLHQHLLGTMVIAKSAHFLEAELQPSPCDDDLGDLCPLSMAAILTSSSGGPKLFISFVVFSKDAQKRFRASLHERTVGIVTFSFCWRGRVLQTDGHAHIIRIIWKLTEAGQHNMP